VDTLTVRLDPNLSKKVKIYCISHDIKFKDFITEALEKEYQLKCK
jgi:hypothetical protein